MAIRTDFAPGEVLAAGDLNDTFEAKLNLAGGKILQVVRATDTTDRTTSSSSYVDVTGMSVTISPQKSTSAVVLILTGRHQTSGNAVAEYQITDNSNNPVSGAENIAFNAGIAPTGVLRQSFTALGYSTPATTSATTYKTRFRSTSAVTITLANSLLTGQLYAIEVSA